MSVTTTPSVRYEAASRTVAVLNGPPQKSFPLPAGCPIQLAAYQINQDFEILASSFPPTVKNKPSNAGGIFPGLLDANAILTSLSQASKTAGGKVSSSATFNIVPASWDDYQTQNITFPGIRDVNYTGGVRDPKPLSVTVRIHNDYFVIDPGNILGSGCTSGGGVAAAASVVDSGSSAVQCVYSIGEIPEIRRTPFGFLVSSAMLTTSEVTGLVKRGGITGWFETVPSTERYQTWMAYAVAHGWDSTVWDGQYADPDSTATTHQGVTTIAQWCFENSRLTQYAGNIYCRSSFYTLAN